MTATALMRGSSAPRGLSPAWEHAMRRLHRNCQLRSSVAISEMCGRSGVIHNQTTAAGAQAMGGGFLTPDFRAAKWPCELIFTLSAPNRYGYRRAETTQEPRIARCV